jgi:hypothetical protein
MINSTEQREFRMLPRSVCRAFFLIGLFVSVHAPTAASEQGRDQPGRAKFLSAPKPAGAFGG